MFQTTSVATISVYGTDNRPRTNIGGIYPLWNHAATIRPRTAQDWIYDRSEDFVLANPYQVCGGEEEGIYFVTEPYLSSVTKLRIASFDAPDTSAELVTIIGNRRDNGDRKNTAASQFNCVTAVIGIERKECPPSTEAYEARAGHGKPNTEGLEVAASDRGVLFDTISNSLADRAEPSLPSLGMDPYSRAQLMNWSANLTKSC
ncbi:MAG: hypothetical protein IPH35_18935 [Rhodoferax sp.]|nr:hypothetical protein [Rhodoferax sp.]